MPVVGFDSIHWELHENWKELNVLHQKQMTFEALVVRRLFPNKLFAQWFTRRYIDRPCFKHDYSRVLLAKELQCSANVTVALLSVVFVLIIFICKVYFLIK